MSGHRTKLRVRVHPGAKRDELLGFQEGVLRLRLAAPPIEGKANKALVVFLAGLLDLPKSSVTIRAGVASRDKVVDVEGLAEDEVLARLRQHLGQ